MKVYVIVMPHGVLVRMGECFGSGCCQIAKRCSEFVNGLIVNGFRDMAGSSGGWGVLPKTSGLDFQRSLQ